MEYTWDFKVILDSFPLLLRGLVVTIELWVLAFAIGLSLGFTVSLARVSDRVWLNAPAIGYVEIFRNTPVLVQLIWFYYAFPIILGQQLSPFTAAALALTLNTSAYCAEIFRGGIVSIARGQWEGAKAIGMTRAMTMRRVILPQVLKRMLPAFTNLALVYFVLIYPGSYLSGRLERRLAARD
ncbi:MAG: ABC transporter permease [Betaproteobacteria bacterium 13_1_20CM_3_63_8]|nr:MAG: ABC transporter permease [Betaproteobacteria bacterium 13_1_20CM_3_63_8]